MPGRWASVILVISLSIHGGCASGPESRPRMSYRASAKENFLKGQKKFEDKDYVEAAEFFRFVKTKYPYSTYATEAELYLADCSFERDKFAEAAEAYRNFAKLHPRHPKVPYALFRAALCHFEQIPGDWFLSPPVYELDQTETHIAIRELERFLRQFPDDENSARARELLDKCRLRMARQARYLMDFYRKRNQPRGVLWRAEELLRDYSSLGFDEEALFEKGRALVDLEDFSAARSALLELLSRFPDGDYASRAKKLLDGLASPEVADEVGATPADEGKEAP